MVGRMFMAGLITLAATTAFAQGGRGGPVVLNFEEISKVMEKLPPILSVASSPDVTNWSCVDVDLREHCSDLDGCAVNLHMQHKVDGSDTVRGIKEQLYFESLLTSSSRAQGLNGYTRQAGGGEYGWVTGTAAQHTLFNPWGWAAAYNYRPSFCPGQAGRNSPAHRDPYLITVASHPHVNTVVILED